MRISLSSFGGEKQLVIAFKDSRYISFKVHAILMFIIWLQ